MKGERELRQTMAAEVTSAKGELPFRDTRLKWTGPGDPAATRSNVLKFVARDTQIGMQVTHLPNWFFAAAINNWSRRGAAREPRGAWAGG